MPDVCTARTNSALASLDWPRTLTSLNKATLFRQGLQNWGPWCLVHHQQRARGCPGCSPFIDFCWLFPWYRPNPHPRPNVTPCTQVRQLLRKVFGCAPQQTLYRGGGGGGLRQACRVGRNMSMHGSAEMTWARHDAVAMAAMLASALLMVIIKTGSGAFVLHGRTRRSSVIMPQHSTPGLLCYAMPALWQLALWHQWSQSTQEASPCTGEQGRGGGTPPAVRAG
ncbi:hypothetical protein ABBQ38_012201 [Trebouxia sp. C0009 RCD-2024]